MIPLEMLSLGRTPGLGELTDGAVKIRPHVSEVREPGVTYPFRGYPSLTLMGLKTQNNTDEKIEDFSIGYIEQSELLV